MKKEPVVKFTVDGGIQKKEVFKKTPSKKTSTAPKQKRSK